MSWFPSHCAARTRACVWDFTADERRLPRARRRMADALFGPFWFECANACRGITAFLGIGSVVLPLRATALATARILYATDSAICAPATRVTMRR
jgi:hypothetical protein